MYFSTPHRRLTLTVIGCLMAVSVVTAQKKTDPAPLIKFGQFTPDQFTRPLSDSTAEAVVQYNYGEVHYEVSSDELWIVLERHVRTLIRRKSAYERATITLPVRRGKSGQPEFVSNFEGTTYNLVNGSVTFDKLAKSAHFTEKVSDGYSLEKYTLPNVREGSIIEYRYTLRTPFSISSNPRTWYFQQDVPVAWSEYRITIPNYYYYKMMLGGYLNLTVNEQKSATVSLLPGQYDAPAVSYRFAQKDVPAFRDEAYITTDDDYLSKIDFELASVTYPGEPTKNFSVGWDAMDQTLLTDNDFGGQIKRAGFLRETAKQLLGKSADTLARITAAYDFVRQTIKWNEETSYWSRSIKKVFDDKKGDAGDINLLLVALLREMDIDANPVILSTRSHGRVDVSYALLKKFNYVVAQVSVGGKDLLLDATDPYLKPGMLPLHCLNGTGRLVHSSAPRFVSLAPTERDAEVITGTFTLDEEGELTGTFSHSHGGYSAWSTRKLFAAEGKTKYLDGIVKKRAAWQVQKADFTGTEPKSDAFGAVYTLTIPDACAQAGDRMYLRPMLTEAHTENPFKEAERLYPVDFGTTIDETFTATYTLPAGFQVEELPKPVAMTLPDNGGRFVYQVASVNGNQLQVVSRISLRRTMYFATDYPTLREFFSQIVAKHAEQVVLKRGTVAEKK